MAQKGSQVEKVGETAKEAAREAAPWVERFARFGYAARGVVYVTIGLLAERTAFRRTSEQPDSDSALRAIVIQPFGRFLVALLAAGLIGYVLWRLVQAVVDPEQQCKGVKGFLQRIAYALGALIHAGIALSAIRLLMGSRINDQSGAPKSWTAEVISQPFGPWLVGIAGVIIICVGGAQFYQALNAGFRDQIKLVEMSRIQERWMLRVSRFGLLARGVVFGIIGVLLIQAAIRLDPHQAEGLGGALQKLAQQPYGPWLLSVVAGGLIAYGIHNMMMARYRRMPGV